MNTIPDDLDISSSGIQLRASWVPWDSEAFGFPVAQIYDFKVNDPLLAMNNYQQFEEWRDTHQIRIVSCRLPHDRLQESMFLESKQFRFVEMVLHPVISDLHHLHISKDKLVIASVLESDLPTAIDIAERAFGHDRYHIDPRLDPCLGSIRYGRWVQNTLNHPQQRLLKIIDDKHVIAFFITEFRGNKTVYWHLTAISPQWQGKGYGQRVWRAMLCYHQEEGQDCVMTTISARNTAVLNLYAKLDFRFLPPEMTFHWVRCDK